MILFIKHWPRAAWNYFEECVHIKVPWMKPAECLVPIVLIWLLLILPSSLQNHIAFAEVTWRGVGRLADPLDVHALHRPIPLTAALNPFSVCVWSPGLPFYVVFIRPLSLCAAPRVQEKKNSQRPGRGPAASAFSIYALLLRWCLTLSSEMKRTSRALRNTQSTREELAEVRYVVTVWLWKNACVH